MPDLDFSAQGTPDDESDVPDFSGGGTLVADEPAPLDFSSQGVEDVQTSSPPARGVTADTPTFQGMPLPDSAMPMTPEAAKQASGTAPIQATPEQKQASQQEIAAKTSDLRRRIDIATQAGNRNGVRALAAQLEEIAPGTIARDTKLAGQVAKMNKIGLAAATGGTAALIGYPAATMALEPALAAEVDTDLPPSDSLAQYWKYGSQMFRGEAQIGSKQPQSIEDWMKIQEQDAKLTAAESKLVPGEGFFRKGIQALASSAPGMIDTLVQSGGFAPSSYKQWMDQGTGAILREALRGRDVRSMSKEQLDEFYYMAKGAGALYAGVEFAQSPLALTKALGFDVGGQFVGRLLKKAAENPAFKSKVVRMGMMLANNAGRVAAEAAEEGPQQIITELATDSIKEMADNPQAGAAEAVGKNVAENGLQYLARGAEAVKQAVIPAAGMILGGKVVETPFRLAAAQEAKKKAAAPGPQPGPEDAEPVRDIEKFKQEWREAELPEDVITKLADNYAKGDKAGEDAIIAEYEASQAAAAREAAKTPATTTEEAPTPTQGPAPEGGKAAQAGPVAANVDNTLQAAQKQMDSDRADTEALLREALPDTPIKITTNPHREGVAVSPDGKTIEASHDLARKLKERFPGREREALGKIVDEERIHQEQIGKLGDGFKAKLASVWKNASRQVRHAVNTIYGPSRQTATADEMGAELLRMAAQSRRGSGLTESMHPTRGKAATDNVGIINQWADEQSGEIAAAIGQPRESTDATGPAIQVDRADGEVAPDTAAGAVRRDGESDTAGVEAARPPAPAKGTGVRASPDVQPQEKVKEKAREVVPEKPEVQADADARNARRPQLPEGRQAADETPEPRKPDVLSRQAQPAVPSTSTAGGVAGPSTWYRGTPIESAEGRTKASGDEFYSASKGTAQEYQYQHGPKKKGKITKHGPEVMPKNPLRVESKEALAETMGESDPDNAAFALDFDAKAKAYARERGHDGILYENGTEDFDTGERPPELHVFKPLSPESTPTRTEGVTSIPPTQEGAATREIYPQESEDRIKAGLNPAAEAENIPDAPIISVDVLNAAKAAPIHGTKADAIQERVFRGLLLGLATHSPHTADMFYGSGTVTYYLHKIGALKPGHTVSEFEPLRATMVKQLAGKDSAEVAAETKKMVRHINSILRGAEKLVENVTTADEMVAAFAAYLHAMPNPSEATADIRAPHEAEIVDKVRDSLNNWYDKFIKDRGIPPGAADIRTAWLNRSRLYSLQFWSNLKFPAFLAPDQDLAAMRKRMQKHDELLEKHPELEAMDEDTPKDATQQWLFDQLQKYTLGEPPKLVNTPEAAGFYMAIQWATGSDVVVATAPGDIGGLRPLFTLLGITAKTQFTDAEIDSLVKKNHEALKDSEPMQADSWPEIPKLAERKPGVLIVADPSYFAKEGESTKNYGPFTEIKKSDQLMKLVDKYLLPAWKKGARIILTNTYEADTVKRLQERGFNVVTFKRKDGSLEFAAYNANPSSGEILPLRPEDRWSERDRAKESRRFEFKPRSEPDAAGGAAGVQASKKRVEQGAAGEDGGRGGVAPIFFSQVERTVEGAKQPKAPGAQWMAWLKGQPGIKQEEIEWLGLAEWLGDQKSVTRDALLDFIRANKIDVQTVPKSPEAKGPASVSEPFSVRRVTASETEIYGVKTGYWALWDDPTEGELLGSVPGDMDLQRATDELVNDAQRSGVPVETLGMQSTKETKFDQWQEPGFIDGTYREIILTLPNMQGSKGAWRVTNPRTFQSFTVTTYGEVLDYRSRGWTVRDDESAVAPAFHSSHFPDVKNPLAHGRVNDRWQPDPNGPSVKLADGTMKRYKPGDVGERGWKVLFVEEFQSDWATQVREYGFRKIWKESDIAKFTVKDSNDVPQLRDKSDWVVFDEQGQVIATPPKYLNSKEEALRVVAKGARDGTLGGNFRAAPRAPFVGKPGAWSMLLFKRLLRYAAESGYDRIAWTKGATQADRYDLSKKVKHIAWEKNDDGTYNINAPLPNGEPGIYKEDLTLDEVKELVGKDVAKQIEEGNGRPIKRDGYREWTAIEGENLRVGSQGMTGFYDQILPSEVNKYVKKWGGRVGETEVQVSTTANIPKFKPFSREDDMSFGGAEDFEDGSKPVISSTTIAIDGKPTQVTVIVSGTGIAFISPEAAEEWQASWDFLPPPHRPESREEAESTVRLLWPQADSRMWKAMRGVIGKGTEAGPYSAPEKVHSLDITPDMRDAALAGQPLFSKRRKTGRTTEKVKARAALIEGPVDFALSDYPIPYLPRRAKDRTGGTRDPINSVMANLRYYAREGTMEQKRIARELLDRWTEQNTRSPDEWYQEMAGSNPAVAGTDLGDFMANIVAPEIERIMEGRELTPSEQFQDKQAEGEAEFVMRPHVEAIEPGSATPDVFKQAPDLAAIGTTAEKPYRIVYPEGTVEAYRAAEGWHVRTNRLLPFRRVDGTKAGRALAASLDARLAAAKGETDGDRTRTSRQPETDVVGDDDARDFKRESQGQKVSTLKEVLADAAGRGILREITPQTVSRIEYSPEVLNLDEWRDAAELAESIGIDLIPTSNSPYNGVKIDEVPDAVFVDADNQFPIVTTMGHEAHHILNRDYDTGTDDPKTNPALALRMALDEQISAENVQRYLSGKLGAKYRHLSDEKVREEMHADFMGEMLTKKSFWDRLYRISQKAFDVLANIVNRILGHARVDAHLSITDYFADIAKAQDAAAAFYKHVIESKTERTAAPSDELPFSAKREPNLFLQAKALEAQPPEGMDEHRFTKHVRIQEDVPEAVRKTILQNYYEVKPKKVTSDNAARRLKQFGDVNAAEASIFGYPDWLADERIAAAIMLHAKYVDVAANESLSKEIRDVALRRLHNMGHWIDDHFKQYGQAINQAKLFYHDMSSLQGQVSTLNWMREAITKDQTVDAPAYVEAIAEVAQIERVQVEKQAQAIPEDMVAKAIYDEVVKRYRDLEQSHARLHMRSSSKVLKALVDVIADPVRRNAASLSEPNKKIAERGAKAMERLKAKMAGIQASEKREEIPGDDIIPEPDRTDLIDATVDQIRETGMADVLAFTKWFDATFGTTYKGKEVSSVWYDAVLLYGETIAPYLTGPPKAKHAKAKESIKKDRELQMDLPAQPSPFLGFSSEELAKYRKTELQSIIDQTRLRATGTTQPTPEEAAQMDLAARPDAPQGDIFPKELFLKAKAQDVIDLSKLSANAKAVFLAATTPDTTMAELYAQAGVPTEGVPYTNIIDTKLADLLTGPVLEKAIREHLRTWNESLARLAMQDASAGETLAGSLAKQLTATFGLTPYKASILEQAIRKKVVRMTEAARQKELKRILSKKPDVKPRTRKQKQALDRVVSLNNLGAFDQQQIHDAILRELGILKPITTDEMEQLKKNADAVKNAPEGFQQRDAVIDARHYISKLAGPNWYRLGMGVIYNNLLFNYRTDQRNFISNLSMATSSLISNIAADPKTAPARIAGYIQGTVPGLLEASAAMRGMSVVRMEGKLELPGGTRFRDLPGKAGKLLAPLDIGNISAMKLVAGDMLLFKPAEYAHMEAMVLNELLQEGISYGQAVKQAREKLYGTKAERMARRQQAEREIAARPGKFTRLGRRIDISRRAEELRLQSLPQDQLAQARMLAAIDTFNFKSEGILGHISQWLSAFGENKDIALPARLAVRNLVLFTNIIANVSNFAWAGLPVLGKVQLTGRFGLRTYKSDYDRVVHHRLMQMNALAVVGILLADLVASGFFDDDEDEKKKKQKDPWFAIYGLGPDDKAERELMRGEGWKPFTIKVGDRYYQYQLITPLAGALTVLGSIRDAQRYGLLKDEKSNAELAAYGAMTLAQSMLNMSFLSTTADLLSAISEPSKDLAIKSINKFLSSIPGRLVPAASLQREVAYQIDPRQFEAKGVLENLMRDIPFASKHLEPSVNILGDEVIRDRSVLITKAKPDPVYRLLADNDAVPSYPGKATRIEVPAERADPDGTAKLTPDEYHAYVKISGQLIKRQVTEELSDLRAMSAKEVQDRVEKITKDARDQAKAAIEQAAQDPSYDPETLIE